MKFESWLHGACLAAARSGHVETIKITAPADTTKAGIVTLEITLAQPRPITSRARGQRGARNPKPEQPRTTIAGAIAGGLAAILSPTPEPNPA